MANQAQIEMNGKISAVTINLAVLMNVGGLIGWGITGSGWWASVSIGGLGVFITGLLIGMYFWRRMASRTVSGKK